MVAGTSIHTWYRNNNVCPFTIIYIPIAEKALLFKT
jgi:hypothetical protein